MEFKIVLIGNEGVGKSSLLKRHLTGEYSAAMLPTLGTEVFPIRLYTTVGIIQLNVWDCSGKECFRELSDGYYIMADAFVGVMEYCNNASVSWLQQELKRYKPNVPVITCVNKYEYKRKNRDWDAVFLDAIKVSAKCNYNLDKLFLKIARKLTGNNNLKLVEPPAISPPEV